MLSVILWPFLIGFVGSWLHLNYCDTSITTIALTIQNLRDEKQVDNVHQLLVNLTISVGCAFKEVSEKPIINSHSFTIFLVTIYENVLKIKTTFEGGRSVEKAWFHLNKEIISVFCSQLWMWFALQMTCHLVFDWWSWIMTWSDRKSLSIARYTNCVIPIRIV